MSKQTIRGASESNPPAQLVTFPRPPAAATPKARTSRKSWLIGILLALLVLAGIAITWWELRSANSVDYVTVPVTVGPIARTVTATGTINPVLTIIVGTYVSGVIQELYCDYNTQVKRGQLCAKIDDRPYKSIVDQARANLAVANAQLEKDKASLTYAKVTLERNEKLVVTSAVSKDAYDNSRSVYEQARAQITFDEATIQQRQAVLDAAQVNLDYTNIVSPVDGTVVSRNVTMGQTVAASFQTPTLFLIATDLTKMEVDTNVSESDIGGIREGNRASFTVDAYPKRTFDGMVSQVRQSPQTVQNVVTYDVVVSVDNPDLVLKPGLTATTRVIIEQRDGVIRVPNQALRYTPGGVAAANRGNRLQTGGAADRAQVWVLRDGEPALVRVVTGLADDNLTEIVSGDLKLGEEVIIAERRAAGGGRTGLPQPRF